jgi:hypothetical protein
LNNIDVIARTRRAEESMPYPCLFVGHNLKYDGGIPLLSFELPMHVGGHFFHL